MIKTLPKVSKARTYLNIIKVIYDAPTANNISIPTDSFREHRSLHTNLNQEREGEERTIREER